MSWVSASFVPLFKRRRTFDEAPSRNSFASIVRCLCLVISIVPSCFLPYRQVGVEAVGSGNTRRLVGRAAGGDTLARDAAVLHPRHRVRRCGHVLVFILLLLLCTAAFGDWLLLLLFFCDCWLFPAGAAACFISSSPFICSALFSRRRQTIYSSCGARVQHTL